MSSGHGASISPDFIRAEIEQQSYEISLHADEERLADGLTVSDRNLSCPIAQLSNNIQMIHEGKVAL